MEQNYDVIIAGGGPAGSTAATLLAQYGHRVLLIEQSKHPRFHIGESMIPEIEPIMNRLNLDWGKYNLRKQGADFIDEKSGRNLYFPLQNKFKTYQIERPAFDQRLFENAIKHGVEAHQQEQVVKVDCSEQGVVISSDKAHYQARYFIDATGRSSLMGKKKQSVKRLDNFGKYALYKHYQLQESPEVNELISTGNIQILLRDIGWNWVIPLAGNRLSLGLVVRNNMLSDLKKEDLFQQYIDTSEILTSLLKGATVSKALQMEADFSYINQSRYGLRYACCGDSAGFLDPVFSSGVFFAVKTAELVADRLHQGLIENKEDDSELLAQDDIEYSKGFQTMYLMIERFYASSIIDNLVFEADRHERIKKEITALLSGDLWSEGNLFQQGMLRGRRNVTLNDIK